MSFLMIWMLLTAVTIAAWKPKLRSGADVMMAVMLSTLVTVTTRVALWANEAPAQRGTRLGIYALIVILSLLSFRMLLAWLQRQ